MRLIIFSFLLLFSTAKAQPWVQKASLPVDRWDVFHFSINGKLYVGGGYAYGTARTELYEYDPNTNSWTQKASTPDDVYGAGCFEVNGKGYVVGGYSSGSLTRKVYEYDPTTDSWQTKNDFGGTARHATSGFTLNGKGYIFGGFLGGSSVSAEMWEYTPSTDTWILKGNCPGPGRETPVVLVINNQAYVGSGSESSTTIVYQDFYHYDPVANIYTSRTPVPIGRVTGAFFAIGGYGYMGLGIGSGGSALGDFWKYNPQTDIWTQINNFDGGARTHPFYEVVNGAPYVGTGSPTTSTLGQLPDNWTWEICATSANLGNDTTLCFGNPLILSDTNTNASFLWSTGAMTSSISVSTSGTYWVDVTRNGCTARDSVNVNFISPPTSINIGNDTTYCGTFSRTLQVNTTNSVLWSTNQTTNSITVNNAGTYWVQISNQCGSVRDSIMLSQNTPPVINIGADTNIACTGSNIILDATTPNASYLWQDNSANPSFTATTNGFYWVNVTVNGCTSRDSTFVAFALPVTNGIFDTSICVNETILIGAASPYSTYQWSTNETNATISINTAGIYSQTVSNSCGQGVNTFNIAEKECVCKLVFPTAFSPNEDGKNDSFGAIYRCPLTQFQLHIYNRWGELIFRSDDVDYRWDGNYKDQPQPLDAYVYYYKYTDPYTNQKISKSGNVTLLR